MKILGISCYYHDSAAVLIEDGKVVAAADEERFSRIKHDSGFPEKSIDFCLSFTKNGIQDVDYLVFYEKPFLKFERITLSHLATVPFSRSSFVDAYKTWLSQKLWIKATLIKKLKISEEKILFSNHHLSHAAATFFTSPFEKAAILTVDGVGEWTTTAWGIGNKNKIELIKEVKFPHSLGLFYSAFTQFLGFRVNEGEFKVMGLSPYGKPVFKKQIEKMIYQSSDGSFKLNLKYFNFHKSTATAYSKKFVKLLGIAANNVFEADKVDKKYANIASSVQEVLEDKMLLIAKNIKKETNEDYLCLSGGVALNGVSNWKIFKDAGFKDIFIHPAAGDSGGALGAALYVYYHILNKKRKPLNSFNAYLGKENLDQEIENFLKEKNIVYKKYSNNDLINKVSDDLKKGKVIGWIRGRFEWGPRALGNRSIIADPRSRKMKDVVNKKIKFREAFRPFAPYCAVEDAKKYFDVGDLYKSQPLEHMICVVPVKKDQINNLGAITHVDGTARPQFVRRKENPLYYDLVKKFGEKTGVSVLLNTSFNLKGEPIVNTHEEAYETFLKSGIDILVLNNFYISKVSLNK